MILLSLHKGDCRLDLTRDIGICDCSYAFLPQEGEFGAGECYTNATISSDVILKEYMKTNLLEKAIGEVGITELIVR